jgi:hypothetical protein
MLINSCLTTGYEVAVFCIASDEATLAAESYRYIDEYSLR